MDEQHVTEMLAAAAAAVDKAGVPEELREVAFTAALGLLTGTQPAGGALGGAPAAGPPGPPGQPPTGGSGSGMLDKIAAGLELDVRGVQNLYADKDDAPELIIKASKLPKAKAAAAYDIALLVMAGRQLGEIDDYTEAKVLREATKRYGKFDQSNFGQHMRALDNLILTSGKGPSAMRKLTRPGIEAASELAARCLEEGY